MTSAEAPPAAHGNAASLSWPRCVDPTDLGKPYKLGFRILATRIELTDKLAENGYPIPLGDDWCGQQDGRITVTLPALAEESQRATVSHLRTNTPSPGN